MLTRAPTDSNKLVQRMTAKRSGRPRITTPGQDKYIRVFHLRNRTVAASTTAAGELRRISSQTVQIGFDNMALDPEGRISERY